MKYPWDWISWVYAFANSPDLMKLNELLETIKYFLQNELLTKTLYFFCLMVQTKNETLFEEIVSFLVYICYFWDLLIIC